MERPWTGRCQRCRAQTLSHTMSRFNDDLICCDCEEKEKSHPRYKEACRAEEEAVRAGNRNFIGIGAPYDLEVGEWKP